MKVNIIDQFNQPKSLKIFKIKEPKENYVINMKDIKFIIKNFILSLINENSESYKQIGDMFWHNLDKGNIFQNNLSSYIGFWSNEKYREINEFFSNQFIIEPLIFDSICYEGKRNFVIEGKFIHEERLTIIVKKVKLKCVE